MYIPRVLPSSEGDRLRWLVEEFRALDTALNTKSVAIFRIAQTHNTPDKPRDGDIRYCDGTDLDLGYGVGPYIYEGATSAWVPMFDVPLWDLHFFASGTYTASEVLLATAMVRKVILPANLTGSYAKLLTTATSAQALALVHVASTSTATTFGAISFGAATTTGSFSTTARTFAAGDTLKIVAPASADATMAGFYTTFKGSR